MYALDVLYRAEVCILCCFCFEWGTEGSSKVSVDIMLNCSELGDGIPPRFPPFGDCFG